MKKVDCLYIKIITLILFHSAHGRSVNQVVYHHTIILSLSKVSLVELILLVTY